MTSKQRAALRSIAANEPTIFQIGKDNVGDNLSQAVSDALECRELVKLSVLKTSDLTPRAAAEELAERTKSEVIATIGNKFILYRRSKNAAVKHIEF